MAARERLRSGTWLLIPLATVGVVLVALWRVQSAEKTGTWPETVRIATATESEAYWDVGRGIQEILATLPDRRIVKVRAQSSAGSVMNIDRLVSGETELALVAGTAVQAATREQKRHFRLLAGLYSGATQVVVRRGLGIRTLGDLRDRSIYIGMEGSGTEQNARRILASAGIVKEEVDFHRFGPDEGFGAAARSLLRGSCDAAFFAGGTPTTAVKIALECERRVLPSPRCRLLDLGDHVPEIVEAIGGVVPHTISQGIYRHQDEPVETIANRVYLVGRADLHADLVQVVLDALFDNLDVLLDYHAHVPDEIDIRKAFVDAPVRAPAQYHAGALRFREQERGKLLIASGSLGGRYHQIAKSIQMLLERAGIPSRAIHTSGSLDNASLFKGPSRRVLAIMQYDMALAAYWGKPRAVYLDPGMADEGEVPHVPGMRILAALHEEKVHIVARRSQVGEAIETVHDLGKVQGLRVCRGPEGSGTQAIARTILHHHDVVLGPDAVVDLPVSDMRADLQDPNGSISVGFLVAGQRSYALEDVLEDRKHFRLLPVDLGALSRLTGSTAALRESKIEGRTYDCEGDSIDTVATRAVLVTTDDVLVDVSRITHAVLQGAGMLGIEGGVEDMAALPPSLLAHPDAVTVFQDRGLWPTPDDGSVELLTLILSITVALVGASRGLQLVRRRRGVDRLRGQILQVSLEATAVDPVRKFEAIRAEVRERARRSWWQPGWLGKRYWHELENVIDNRVTQSRSTLSKALLVEARALEGPDASARKALRTRIWEHAVDGELSELQVMLVLQALDDG